MLTRAAASCGRRRPIFVGCVLVRFSAQGLCSGPMKRLSLPFCSARSLCASTALATTYVRVEKDGTKTYSDRPMPGGQPVELAAGADLFGAAATRRPNSNVPREQQLAAARWTTSATRAARSRRTNDATFTNPESVRDRVRDRVRRCVPATS